MYVCATTFMPFFFSDMFRFTKTKYTCIHVVRRSRYICTYTRPHMGGFNAVIASCEVPFAIIKIDQVYDVRIYIYVTSLPSFGWSKLRLVLLIAPSFKGCRFKYG